MQVTSCKQEDTNLVLNAAEQSSSRGEPALLLGTRDAIKTNATLFSLNCSDAVIIIIALVCCLTFAHLLDWHPAKSTFSASATPNEQTAQDDLSASDAICSRGAAPTATG